MPTGCVVEGVWYAVNGYVRDVTRKELPWVHWDRNQRGRLKDSGWCSTGDFLAAFGSEVNP